MGCSQYLDSARLYGINPMIVTISLYMYWVLRGGPAMNREGKPVSAARIRNASADLKEIQSRV